MTVETTHVVHCDYAGCDARIATRVIRDDLPPGWLTTIRHATLIDFCPLHSHYPVNPTGEDYCPLHSPDTVSLGVGLKHGSVPSVVEPSRAPIVNPTGAAT